MGGGELAAGSVVAAEDDGNLELPAGHVAHLRGVVEDLVRRHEAERPAHELDDGPQTVHGRADAQAGKTCLTDGRVNNAFGAKALEHALADLVGAVVVGHFLAHEEDAGVALHLLGHCLVERFAELEGCAGGHARDSSSSSTAGPLRSGGYGENGWA